MASAGCFQVDVCSTMGPDGALPVLGMTFGDMAEAEGAAEIEVFKPDKLGVWFMDAVPTQASLTPYIQEEGVAYLKREGPAAASSADNLGRLSSQASSNDLESLDETESEEESARRPSTVPLASGPKFLSGLELSQLNWKRLANGQEWRRDLLLRGLPRALCEKGTLEAFLAAKGLRELVSELRVLPGKGLRPGSATVLAVSGPAVERLARFFHGAQLPGARSPVAVSFTPGRGLRGDRREPMRVQVPLPPGLECWTCPF
mmetsp:Transcript_37208/g.107183  ORF Transcript_37208/g.107183 Transcript_37208/m.107183 type:complete len:260 (+) Transcript_37208:75-854(+)